MTRRPMAMQVPVSPLKGQILRLRLPAGQTVSHKAYRYTGHFYVAPQANGEVWVGTTEEAGAEFDTTTTGAGRRHIAELLREISSPLDVGGGGGGEHGRPEIVKQTACLRPATTDGMPIIGRVPGTSNVFIATGHGAVGIQLSPVTGLASELLQDVAPPFLRSSCLVPPSPNRCSCRCCCWHAWLCAVAELVVDGECRSCDLKWFGLERFGKPADTAPAVGEEEALAPRGVLVTRPVDTFHAEGVDEERDQAEEPHGAGGESKL